MIIQSMGIQTTYNKPTKVNVHPGFIASIMGTIAATPPAEMRHRTKFTAAVAVAGESRWRSIRSVFVVLKEVDIPNPMKKRITSGMAMWTRYLMAQPNAISANVPMA